MCALRPLASPDLKPDSYCQLGGSAPGSAHAPGGDAGGPKDEVEQDGGLLPREPVQGG